MCRRTRMQWGLGACSTDDWVAAAAWTQSTHILAVWQPRIQYWRWGYHVVAHHDPIAAYCDL